MGNLYKNCKIQDNTAELIYEKGSLFVTIFENNIVHVAQKPGIESVAIEEGFIPNTFIAYSYKTNWIPGICKLVNDQIGRAHV